MDVAGRKDRHRAVECRHRALSSLVCARTAPGMANASSAINGSKQPCSARIVRSPDRSMVPHCQPRACDNYRSRFSMPTRKRSPDRSYESFFLTRLSDADHRRLNRQRRILTSSIRETVSPRIKTGNFAMQYRQFGIERARSRIARIHRRLPSAFPPFRAPYAPDDARHRGPAARRRPAERRAGDADRPHGDAPDRRDQGQ